MLRTVHLPLPEGPLMAKRLPAGTAKVASSRIRVALALLVEVPAHVFDLISADTAAAVWTGLIAPHRPRRRSSAGDKWPVMHEKSAVGSDRARAGGRGLTSSPASRSRATGPHLAVRKLRGGGAS